MCENCKRLHEEAMKQVNEEMDEQGIPDDSVLRGLADIHVACSNYPLLGLLMSRMYPTTETMLESPIDMTRYTF